MSNPLTKADLLRLLQDLPMTANIFIEAISRSDDPEQLRADVDTERQADPEALGALGGLEGVDIVHDDGPTAPAFAILLHRSDYLQ